MSMQRQERASKIPPSLRWGTVVAAAAAIAAVGALYYLGRTDESHTLAAVSALGFSMLALWLNYFKTRSH
jgi:hypothetical protein